ncbi:ATP cone domain-containing protein, partial [Litorivivens sp.]
MQTHEQQSPQSAAQQPPNVPSSAEIQATAPGQLRVIKRNGTVVPYTDDKISVAITKAFLAVEGGNAAGSTRIHETVAKLTSQVSATFKRRMPSGGTIHIEDIQDQVELALMRSGEHKVARDYVLYRAARAEERKKAQPEEKAHPSIRVTQEDGSLTPLDLGRLEFIVNEACEGLADVSAKAVLDEVLKGLYDGVAAHEVNTSLVIAARSLVEKEHNYSYVTARLLLDKLRAEALNFLGIAESATQHDMVEYYPKALAAYVEKGIELELISPELRDYDLVRLGQAIKPENDNQFNYLGLQT